MGEKAKLLPGVIPELHPQRAVLPVQVKEGRLKDVSTCQPKGRRGINQPEHKSFLLGVKKKRQVS